MTIRLPNCPVFGRSLYLCLFVDDLNFLIFPGSSSGRGSHGGPEEEQLDSASALAVPINNGK
jgi:hypothetical protein